RSPVRAARVEAADSPVDCLRREEGGLEVHDRLLFGHGGSGPVSLRVAGGGRYRLVRQIAEQRSRIVLVQNLRRAGGRRRFPSVEHDRAQEFQVGGGKRPAVHRDHIGFAAAIRIVHADYVVVGVGRDGDGNSNQAPCSEQAIGGGSAGDRGHIDIVVTVGAVDRPEDRIETIRLYEPVLDTGG